MVTTFVSRDRESGADRLARKQLPSQIRKALNQMATQFPDTFAAFVYVEGLTGTNSLVRESLLVKPGDSYADSLRQITMHIVADDLTTCKVSFGALRNEVALIQSFRLDCGREANDRLEAAIENRKSAERTKLIPS